MRVLYITHSPHEVHENFAKELGARTRVIPFKTYVGLSKKYPLLGYIYPFLSLIYSLFIRVDEDILFVDGGSSLFIAVFLKLRYSGLRLIYLDCDLLFYNLEGRSFLIKKIMMQFIGQIDGVISVSEHNKKFSSLFLKIPIVICNPYPKDVKTIGTARKQYGLYIGRLDPDKNIKRIIKFALECPHFEKFVIVGEGILRPYVQRISKKNNKLIFFGLSQNVEEYYNMCKFFVHIPDHDPFPCTTMEAALCGCFPLISVGVGTKDLFSDFFVVEDPDKFSEINHKIKYILEHGKEAEEMLKQSIDKINDREKSLQLFRRSFYSVMEQIQ